jgi:hypothetical protein
MRRIFILAALISPGLAFANDPPPPEPVDAKRMASPPTVDGTVGDEEWAEANRFTGLKDSQDGSPVDEGGTFWLGYDEKFVYFAARLEDKKPSEITAIEYRTNVGLYTDDHVSLIIDPVGNDRDWCTFAMNPRGATNLYLPGGTAAKREWSGEFISKGRVTETGWEVEAKIPWQIMRLPAPGPRQVNFNFSRFHKRLDRSFTWSYTPTGKVGYHGKWRQVEIPVSENRRSLKLLPYGYLGAAEDEDFIMNSGVDMKVPLTRDINLVGTINPDFRNIEGDVLSLSFSRFERLAGETRPFFQEGRSYLYTDLYTSQRIQKVDVGASVFGRLGSKTTFGLLNTAHFKEDEEHALVSNLSHSLSARSSLGVALTHLDRKDVARNDAYQLSFSQSFGSYYLGGQYSVSDDSTEGKGHEASANFNYYNNGLNYGLSYIAVTPDYSPLLGFFPETDYKGISFFGAYYKQYKAGPLESFSTYSSMGDYDRYDGGEYRSSTSIGLSSSLRSPKISVSLSSYSAEFLGDKDHQNSVYIGYPHNNSYRYFSVGRSQGEFAGAEYTSTSVSGQYRFNDRFTASLSSQWVKHFEESQQQVFSMSYDFRDDRELSTRIVRRDDDINWYLSYRRTGARGIEYYVILGDPNAERFRNSLVLKVVYPLEILLGK